MSAQKKAKKLTREDLIAAYMSTVLEAEHFPASVYKFCKELKIDEADFYAHFGSMEGLQKGIWISFFNQTHALLEKDASFEEYGNRE